MRGSATLSSLSRKYHMRRPRSVVLMPIVWPSRSLKAATDLRALISDGFCPVIVTTSPTAASSALSLSFASPIPMLTTTLATLGTSITFSYSNSFVICGTILSRYDSRSRGGVSDFVPTALGAAAFGRPSWLVAWASAAAGPWPCSLRLRLLDALVGLVAMPADDDAGAGFEDGVLGPGRPRARRADEHDVRVVERRLEVHDATLGDADSGARAAGLRVALEDVDALDDDLVLVRDRPQDLAGLALVLARGDDYGVAGSKVEPAALRYRFVSKHFSL